MYGFRGLADILNPTAGTALDCGLLAGGVFNKACWCLQFPSLCSQSDYVAARGLENPGVYDTLKQPPVVQAPTGAVLNTPPASGADAQATVDSVIAQQNAEWKAQNSASMQQTQDNLDAFAAQYQQVTSGGVPWWIWALGGVGVFAAVAMGGGSPRRYGR